MSNYVVQLLLTGNFVTCSAKDRSLFILIDYLLGTSSPARSSRALL